MGSSASEARSASSDPGIEAPRAYAPDPNFADLELRAMSGLLVDLVRIVGQVAPGPLDRELQNARILLQQLDSGRRPAAIDNEGTLLRFRIQMLEQGLGRPS